MSITLQIILSIIVCISLYINVNLLLKLEKAKDRSDLLQDEVNVTYKTITNTLETMKVIDSKGGFESDDEVGAVFDALKEELYKLKEL